MPSKFDNKPLTYGILLPGLRAAIDLLKREADMEINQGLLVEATNERQAVEHGHAATGYIKAAELLVEQMTKLGEISSPVEEAGTVQVKEAKVPLLRLGDS